MPSVPPFASPSDVRLLPGVDASLDDVTIGDALRRATNAIVAELGWPVWEHEGTVTAYGSTVVLPALHVTEVLVSVGAVEQDPAWFTWTPSGIVGMPRWGYFTPTTVTYTAGFTVATLPEVIKDACVDLAASGLSGQASNLRSWTVGGESETYDTSIDTAYSLGTDRRLDDYRLTAAVA